MADAHRKSPPQGSSEEETVEVTPTEARAGLIIGGRTLGVLVVSLLLALVAMAVLLNYFYGFYRFTN